MSAKTASPLPKLQRRLLSLAALFLGAYALALTLAPFVRQRSWNADLLWQHWIGYLVWLALFYVVQRAAAQRLPEADPFLIPIAALLSGWGLLSIFRLFPAFGLRQAAWLTVAAAVLIAGMGLSSRLGFLRRYKYLWLTSGLLLTGLTLVFGANPLGYGPRMWLGCCGIYLQPSEPLKLLLIIYLAAYLADRQPLAKAAQAARPLLPLLAPTLIMTGIALLLLAIQRDLGTATIFVFLYTTIVYLSTGRKQILLIGAVLLLLAAVVGGVLFDVVQVRLAAWINPWNDPSGNSYQIVQSLIAIANGGILGRGPGAGSPGLVPVPHSDFIYAAIIEESGLAGGIVLLLMIGLFSQRGLRAALRATNTFRRLLAGGLTAFLAAQSILIIGGNLRLLPLTGVTLPFVSYGGSSLVTTFISLLLLLHISNTAGEPAAPVSDARPYGHLQLLLLLGLAAAALLTGWWSIYRAPALLSRTDNLRLGIADRFVPRGALLDRRNQPITQTVGEIGDYTRIIVYPPLSNVVGYNHPLYGQSGFEANFDPILRGLRYYPDSVIWQHQLLYGMPPPGRDIRLSLDLELQTAADQALGDRRGALVLINAQSGEILAMASHPTFDANRLEESWPTLIANEDAPLLNRAVQGRYTAGGVLAPLLWMKAQELDLNPSLPEQTVAQEKNTHLECAFAAPPNDWAAQIAAGCPRPMPALAAILDKATFEAFFIALGLGAQPRLNPLSAGQTAAEQEALPEAPPQNWQVSPLQIALAVSPLSAGGLVPNPRLALEVHTAAQGWQNLPAIDPARLASTTQAAGQTALALQDGERPIWSVVSLVAPEEDEPESAGLTWFIGGSLPDAGNRPVALALVLEEENPALALEIGRRLLAFTLGEPVQSTGD